MAVVLEVAALLDSVTAKNVMFPKDQMQVDYVGERPLGLS